MHDQMDELKRRRAESAAMGGPERVAAQHAKGRMTARERVSHLVDPNSFIEIGGLAWADEPDLRAPADGVVTGYGKIGGRTVCVTAEDFTVLGGSWGQAGARKNARTADVALTRGFPFVWLADGGGGRVQGGMGSHVLGSAGSGVFDAIVEMTGVVPRATGIMGAAFGISAFMGGLADFVVMVKGGAWGMAGPPVVRAAIGEEITAEDLGGADVHARITGQLDRVAKDDAECLRLIREFLSFMPSNSREQPPITTCADPVDRREEALLDVMPENTNRPYDVLALIRLIVDDGKLFPLKPDFATNLVTGLARMGGRPVGVMANQPLFLGGSLEAKSADKAARFARLCGNFHIPMVFLIDTPGFLVGRDVEQESTLSKAMNMLQCLNDARVPKIALFIRKGYGLGFHVMAGVKPSLRVAWPSAQIGIMGPEAGVEVIHRRQLAAAADPAALRDRLLAEWRAQLAPWEAATRSHLDDVIDPRETRPYVIKALDALCPSQH